MLFSFLLVLSLPFGTYAAETVLGVYIFSRHGDRTAKSTPPVNLTDLGYSQVFTSGTYFRNRYVASNASSRIAGVNSDIVRQSQITASAPLDTVLMNSAQGFLQGLYPPVGSTLGSETLRDGSVVQAPLNGYQLVPIQTVSSGTGSEDSVWLQGSSNCAQAIASSKDYSSTADYNDLLASTEGFYKTLTPLLNETFSPEEISYKNAYAIYDLLAVASIHNASLASPLLTPSTLTHLRTLAHHHEFSLAYNASAPVRAIAGSTLAAQILQSLNQTITTRGRNHNKLTVEFGAYASFLSFFGLADLTRVPSGAGDGGFFDGIPGFASAMVFELFTDAEVDADDDGGGEESTFPAVEDLKCIAGSLSPVRAIGDRVDLEGVCGGDAGVCGRGTGAVVWGLRE
ncbi:MAG: hypothetical protein Q9216_000071 [Gyalolechia sp. 2 TL-2023]